MLSNCKDPIYVEACVLFSNSVHLDIIHTGFNISPRECTSQNAEQIFHLVTAYEWYKNIGVLIYNTQMSQTKNTWTRLYWCLSIGKTKVGNLRSHITQVLRHCGGWPCNLCSIMTVTIHKSIARKLVVLYHKALSIPIKLGIDTRR